jgi:hypothetical protein
MEWLLVVALFAAGIAFAIYRGTRRSVELRTLAERGRPVAGRVTLLTRRMTKSGRRLLAVYEYQVEGRTYTGNSMLTRAQHASLSQGGPIVLVYLPEDPRIAAPEFKLPDEQRARG